MTDKSSITTAPDAGVRTGKHAAVGALASSGSAALDFLWSADDKATASDVSEKSAQQEQSLTGTGLFRTVFQNYNEWLESLEPRAGASSQNKTSI